MHQNEAITFSVKLFIYNQSLLYWWIDDTTDATTPLIRCLLTTCALLVSKEVLRHRKNRPIEKWWSWIDKILWYRFI